LDEININIKYNASLACAACIRGGYFYCDKTSSGQASKCCEFTDISCLTDFFQLKCMSTNWKDRFNSLFNFCGSIQANATCGNSTITLDAIGNSTEFNIQSLGFGESCTYGVISNCGYPKIQINQTGIDVVVANLNSSGQWKFNDPNFSFKAAMTETLKGINGQISYTYADWQNEGKDESCGKNRTIIITITNLNQPTQEQMLLQ